MARWSQSCWTMGTRKDYLEPRKGAGFFPFVVVISFPLRCGAAFVSALEQLG